MDIDDLDFYYEDCVIGGPSSFVVAVSKRDRFKEAIRTNAGHGLAVSGCCRLGRSEAPTDSPTTET
jgi:hypothetical protein